MILRTLIFSLGVLGSMSSIAVAAQSTSDAASEGQSPQDEVATFVSTPAQEVCHVLRNGQKRCEICWFDDNAKKHCKDEPTDQSFMLENSL